MESARELSRRFRMPTGTCRSWTLGTSSSSPGWWISTSTDLSLPIGAWGMDLELLDWSHTHTFPEEAKFQDLAYAEPAYRQFTHALKHSFTTRAAIFATAHTEATPLLMDLLDESGLITYVGRVNMDRDCPEPLRESDPKAALEETRRWLDAVQGRYHRTRPILTPPLRPHLLRPLLESLGQLARETKLPVQSHLSENPKEIALVQERFPDASCYAQVYDRFGLLSTRASWPTASTPGQRNWRFSKSGAFSWPTVRNPTPTSPPVWLRPAAFFGAGALGWPGLRRGRGGSSLNLFRAMAHAVQASKLRWRLLDEDTPPLTFPQVFWLATLGGGRFFGPVGTFAKGYAFAALVLTDRLFPHRPAPAHRAAGRTPSLPGRGAMPHRQSPDVESYNHKRIQSKT